MRHRRAWILGSLVYLFAAVLFPIRTELLNIGDEGVFIVPDGVAEIDSDTLYRTLNALDESGRRWYAWSEVSLDLAFPLIYAALISALLRLAWSGPRQGRWRARLWRLGTAIFPAAIALADLVENAGLFRAARLDEWSTGAQRGAVIAALDTLAPWLLPAHALKMFLLAMVPVALLVALAASRRLGSVAALVWLARVPLLAIGVLLALPWLGAADRLSPTIPNLMALRSPLHLAVVILIGGFTAMIAGASLTLIWRRGEQRSATPLPEAPTFLPDFEGTSDRRVLAFTVLALPLVVRCLLRSLLLRDLSWSGAGVALLAGAALLAAAGQAVAHLTGELAGLPADHLLRRWSSRLLSVLGRSGYGDDRGVYPAHALATAAALLGVIGYCAGYLLFTPTRVWPGSDALPALAYLLGSIAFLTSLLSGVTFYFDRFRVPVLAVMLVWAVVANLLRPTDHVFPWRWEDRPLASVPEAAGARLALQSEGPRVLTVVAASGGGIQAAAWSARVLGGLQQALGGRFARSVALISATSGGSVGAYFYLAALDDRGDLPLDRVERLTSAASRSSLEETAWGLLYPDLLRGLAPFAVSNLRDRAWAMERRWLRTREAMATTGDGADSGEEWFGRWAERARNGSLPAVVLNSTRIDDGNPLWLSSVALSVEGLDGPRERRSYSYDSVPARTGFFDLPTVTAARLSATFPFVTPIARPQENPRCVEPPCRAPWLERWHAGDGGYFDNHGAVAALSWLRGVTRGDRAPAKTAAAIVWLQIDSFPVGTTGAGPENRQGWTYSTLGPLSGLVRVRTASQRVRRAVELDLLQAVAGGRVVVVNLRPPAPRSDAFHRGPPLSWELSPLDLRQIERDWQEVEASWELTCLRQVFDDPLAEHPACRQRDAPHEESSREDEECGPGGAHG